MNPSSAEALDVIAFERRAQTADQLGPEPDTVFLGLFGEVGSLVSALKKKRRDTDGYLGYNDAVLEEIGDVHWYADAVARRAHVQASAAAAAREPWQQVFRFDVARPPASVPSTFSIASSPA